MNLNRRRFSASLLGAGIVPGLAPVAARAQTAAVVEGVHYVRLSEPVPAGGPGKIEVIEFFWYECPHCNAFEPALEAWSKRLPSDVSLRRVPVFFREEPFGPQQRLYYAIEALGLVEPLHRRVFSAIHNDHLPMRRPEDMAAFMAKNGVDREKFRAAFDSFTVQAKAMQARQTAAAYKIDAVPAMGVQGRYYTNGGLASSGAPKDRAVSVNERMLGVCDALIERVRRGGKA